MWQYRILPMGFFRADGGAMFGIIPKRAWSRRYPADENDCCVLAMNCVLAWQGDRVVLLDTGVGDKDLGKLSYYRFSDLKDIMTSVRECGFEPEQVTDVILSHLHFDHCGGVTYQSAEGSLKLAFPRARHYVAETQWANYQQPNPLEEESFREMDMQLVEQSGRLILLDKPIELFPGFFIDIYDGHTVGQLVSSFRTEDELVIFPGDVIPTRAHLSDCWLSAYDTQPLLSYEAKKALLGKTVGEDTRFVFYHEAYRE